MSNDWLPVWPRPSIVFTPTVSIFSLAFISWIFWWRYFIRMVKCWLGIISENILAFKLFFESDIVNFEQKLFSTQKIIFEKKISEKFASMKIEKG